MLYPFKSVAVNANGSIIASADVEVRDRSGALATIYTSTGGAQTNPFSTDADGEFEFYAARGVYFIVTGTDPSDYAETVALGDGFDTVAGLIADTSMRYTPSADYQTPMVAGGNVTAGGFRYEVAAAGASDHHLTTAGGVKLYALPTMTDEFTALQFGAEDASDISDVLQAAIDAALYNVNRAGAYMAGVLIDVHEGTLSRTIHCSYGETRKTIRVSGLGSTYSDNSDAHCGTILTYTATSGPAFAIQGGRKPYLRGFTLIGVADAEIAALTEIAPDNSLNFQIPENHDPKTWDLVLRTAVVTPNRRYNPYAGIAIDPRSGDRPADLSVTAVTSDSPAVITTSTAHNLNSNVPETVSISGLSSQGLPDGEFYSVYVDADTAELYNLDWTATTGTGTGTGTLAFPYPDAPTYPAGAGTPDPDTEKLRTSGFVIEDVNIRGFEVGTVINPGTSNANGDFGQFDGVDTAHCKFAHAVCQSNARINLYHRCNPFGIYAFLSTCHFGNAIGHANAKVEGMGGGYMIKWFECGSTSRQGVTLFDHCHPEGVGMMGTIFSGGSSAAPIVFQSSVVKFNHDWGAPPTLLENFSGDACPITFVGGELRSNYGVSLLTDNIKFHGTYISREDTPDKEYRAQASNNAHFCAASPAVHLGAPVQKRYDLDGVSLDKTTELGEGLVLTGRDYGIPYGASMVSRDPKTGNNPVRVIVPATGFLMSSGSRTFGPTPIADRSITFSLTAFNEARMRQSGYINGNVLMDADHGTVMYIRSVDYVTREIICTLESNWYDNGTDPAGLFDTDWDHTANNWLLYRTDLFTPPSQIFGDFTSGSNIITNVRTVGTVDETDYGLAIGDWYAAHSGAAGAYGNDDTEITAIDTGAGTITLSSNADTTLAQVPLDYWMREPAANEADV